MKKGPKPKPTALRRNPAYRAWARMIDRCFSGREIYAPYAARGIGVCERWRLFENFLEDMGQPPPGTSLDRVDNDLGYSLENCRWATKKQQQRNRTNTLLLTLNGATKSLADWCEIHGANYDVVIYRYKKGWPAENLFIPLKFSTSERRHLSR